MDMGVVEAIYKLKYFIFVDKKHGIWQEHRENTGNLVLIGSMATLVNLFCGYDGQKVVHFFFFFIKFL